MKQKKPMSPVIKAIIGFVFFVVSGLLIGVGGLVDLIPGGSYTAQNGVSMFYGVRAAINYYIGAFGGYVFGVWAYICLAVVAAAGVIMIIEIVLAAKKKKGILIFPILVNAIFTTFLPYVIMVGALIADAHALTPIATWIIVAAFAFDVLAIGILVPELLPLFVPALESANAVKKEEPEEVAPVEEECAEDETEEQPAGLTEEEVQKLIDEAVAKAISEHVDSKHQEKEEPTPVEEEKAEDSTPEEKVEEQVEESDEEKSDEEEPAGEEVPEGGEISEEEAKGYGSSKRRRANFETRLKNSEFDLRHKYYDLRDYIKSYGVKNRVSIPGDTFSAHRKKYAFLTINGKHIRANFALNPDDYKDTPIPVIRAESKKFEDLPLQFKIRSDLSYRRALKLVDDMMAKAGFEKPEGPAKFTQDQNPDEK